MKFTSQLSRQVLPFGDVAQIEGLLVRRSRNGDGVRTVRFVDIVQGVQSGEFLKVQVASCWILNLDGWTNVELEAVSSTPS